jgi:hypothetical protein
MMSLRMIRLLFLALALASSAPADREHLIAQTDQGNVVYRMIACDPAEAPPGGCDAEEQRRLARHIDRYWLEAAVKKYGLALTPAEQAAVDQHVAAREAHVQATAKHFQALYGATLAVRRGEDRTSVLAQYGKQGVTADELDRELRHLPTLAEAQRAAATDQVEDGRRAVRQYYTRPYLLSKLRAMVRKRADTSHLSFDEAEQRFWAEIARETHTRIVDPAYAMPDMKGILDR